MARLVDVPIWYFRDQARIKCTCMQGGNSQLQSLRMFIVTVAMLDNCPFSEQPHPCKSQSLWSMAGQALQYSGKYRRFFLIYAIPHICRSCVTNICDVICDPAPQIYAILRPKYMRSGVINICDVTNICDPVSQRYVIR